MGDFQSCRWVRDHAACVHHAELTRAVMTRVLSLCLLMICIPGCQTPPLSPPGESEKRILAEYQQRFPVVPDCPNYQATHRMIVTLNQGSTVLSLLHELNNGHFPQQWCLMPDELGPTRLGMDLAGDADRDTLIATLERELQFASSVGSGADSPYLDAVLGYCGWRNAHNFPMFTLLATHITEGTSPDIVRSLLGESAKRSTDLWHYKIIVGIHAEALIDVHFSGNRATTCDFRRRFYPPPRIRRH